MRCGGLVPSPRHCTRRGEGEDEGQGQGQHEGRGKGQHEGQGQGQHERPQRVERSGRAMSAVPPIRSAGRTKRDCVEEGHFRPFGDYLIEFGSAISGTSAAGRPIDYAAAEAPPTRAVNVRADTPSSSSTVTIDLRWIWSMRSAYRRMGRSRYRRRQGRYRGGRRDHNRRRARVTYGTRTLGYSGAVRRWSPFRKVAALES